MRHARLAAFRDPTLNRFQVETPEPTDLESWYSLHLCEPVHRRDVNLQKFGELSGRHDFVQ